MIEISLVSNNNVKVLYDDKSVVVPCEIAPVSGEHSLEIFTYPGNIKQIKIFKQALDRKKALSSGKSVLFVFDIMRRHSNFSKHTGSFGTAMLRKDRIKIDD